MSRVRQIALDTETTGLSPKAGHRVAEIGCVEMVGGIPTGNEFHCYINPERDVPLEASAISGLTTEFLKPFPVFARIADDFLTFIGDSQLVIHNAKFDLGFLNHELNLLSLATIEITRAVDTVLMARRQFPGSPANLDALCKRFQIDLSSREKHGAIVDARLLARVYLELMGGRQSALNLGGGLVSQNKTNEAPEVSASQVSKSFTKRHFQVAEHELAQHQELLDTLKNPLWRVAS